MRYLSTKVLFVSLLLSAVIPFGIQTNPFLASSKRLAKLVAKGAMGGATAFGGATMGPKMVDGVKPGGRTILAITAVVGVCSAGGLGYLLTLNKAKTAAEAVAVMAGGVGGMSSVAELLVRNKN